LHFDTALRSSVLELSVVERPNSYSHFDTHFIMPIGKKVIGL
jgi:hypothetical protein